MMNKYSRFCEIYDTYLLDIELSFRYPGQLRQEYRTPRDKEKHAWDVRNGPGCSWVISACFLNQVNGSAPRALEPRLGWTLLVICSKQSKFACTN